MSKILYIFLMFAKRGFKDKYFLQEPIERAWLSTLRYRTKMTKFTRNAIVDARLAKATTVDESGRSGTPTNEWRRNLCINLEWTNSFIFDFMTYFNVYVCTTLLFFNAFSMESPVLLLHINFIITAGVTSSWALVYQRQLSPRHTKYTKNTFMGFTFCYW